MPTLTASAPASMSAFAPSAVPTLPAITSMLKRFFTSRTVSSTFSLCPWAVSITITSTSAASSFSTRSNCRTPIAAPTRRRPRASRQAFGCVRTFSTSRMVMSPRSEPLASRRSSFSTRARLMRRSASSAKTSGAAITSFSLVITSCTGIVARSFPSRNFMSRRVRMPTTLPRREPSAVTGNPETPCSAISFAACASVSFGASVTGSTTTPFSERFTFATSRACTSGDRFLWMMPMPPSCASARARFDSVTVSMGAETSGMRSVMLRVSRVAVSARSGVTVLWAGIRRTSSKVMPSRMILASIEGSCGRAPEPSIPRPKTCPRFPNRRL